MIKGRILVVEDQGGIRELLKAILERDYEVSEADSGAALERALGQEQPDFVLLDLRLPDANGLDLLPTLKEEWPETEVIILTGVPNDGQARFSTAEATKRGAFGVFRKSEDFDVERLLTGVRGAVEKRHQRRGNSASRQSS